MARSLLGMGQLPLAPVREVATANRAVETVHAHAAIADEAVVPKVNAAKSITTATVASQSIKATESTTNKPAAMIFSAQPKAALVRAERVRADRAKVAPATVSGQTTVKVVNDADGDGDVAEGVPVASNLAASKMADMLSLVTLSSASSDKVTAATIDAVEVESAAGRASKDHALIAAVLVISCESHVLPETHAIRATTSPETVAPACRKSSLHAQERLNSILRDTASCVIQSRVTSPRNQMHSLQPT